MRCRDGTLQELQGGLGSCWMRRGSCEMGPCSCGMQQVTRVRTKKNVCNSDVVIRMVLPCCKMDPKLEL